MLRFATTLHPTDFSPLAEHAFQQACSLAQEHGSRLIVPHVAELPALTPNGAVMTAPLPGKVYDKLTEKLSRIRASDAKIHVEHRLEEGNPVAEILRVAQESKCDLIVMGTHGRTGLAHLLMGSVAEKVVRKATCPVLVVKTPFPASPSAQPL